ncbi:sulfurtransferase [Clostridium tarantellae]|uniref:Sulfurtransferase n=1 Tax=Clostridium tarantellae TaxID=39493 RepID=A0A6I1MPS6_9CLOT|nr:sulfurtransferase [Clostridium tarantellae]MPQ44478.1 thiosulfate sulfurtransferase [Clostridium tarantellae]
MKLKKKLGVILVSMFILTGCTSKSKNTLDNLDSIETKIITTDELKRNLGKSNWLIVDTRSNDEFNGWSKNENTGGHIEGATDFSVNWLIAKGDNKEERLEKALKEKGLEKNKNIILYDTDLNNTKKVAAYLDKKGYKNLYSYNLNEALKDKSISMKSYKNYEKIVPAWWINEVITGKKPKTYNNDKYKVIEVSWGEDSPEYNKGHIPGAIHMNTDDFEFPPIWNRKSDEDLEKMAKDYGITVDTTIILYGQNPMPSYRAATILKYMGVKDIRVLNGGYNSWINEGYEVETNKNDKVPVESFGAKVPVNKDFIIDIDEAKKILNDEKNSSLVDIRTWDEYIGKTPGYKDIDIAGRPPKSLWGKAGTNIQNLDNYRNVDNTMKNAKDIINMWKEQGILPEKRLAFYCGTGWRAAEVVWFAETMGIKNVSLYDGGWYEWINDPKNPIEVGAPI